MNTLTPGFDALAKFWLAVLAFAGLFWLWTWAGYPIEWQVCESAHQSTDCPTYYPVMGIVKLVEKYHDFSLFIATAALAGVVVWQIREAKSSSQRQLRAYVFLEKTKIETTKGKWSIWFKIRNFGQTPAHRVVLIYTAQAVDWANNGPAQVPVLDMTEELGSMGPLTDNFELTAPPIGNAPLREIKVGGKAIYLIGTIRYDTVFHTGCTSDFRYYVGGDMGWDGPGEMNADITGNGAT
jgi:hypothetical protein